MNREGTRKPTRRKRPLLVAIVGGSGAGKSWLADELQRLLGKPANRLSLDHFYRDLAHLPPARRARVNFDHPRAVDWTLVRRVLERCAAGRVVKLPQYDFTTHTRSPRWRAWKPGRIVLIDGLWLLRRADVRRWIDLSIFLECGERLRLQRRLRRDVAERGRTRASVRRQFRETVAPMHARHVAPQRRWADLLLKQAPGKKQIGKLAEELKRATLSDP